jgi:hypothetical protein
MSTAQALCRNVLQKLATYDKAALETSPMPSATPMKAGLNNFTKKYQPLAKINPTAPAAGQMPIRTNQVGSTGGIGGVSTAKTASELANLVLHLSSI